MLLSLLLQSIWNARNYCYSNKRKWLIRRAWGENRRTWKGAWVLQLLSVSFSFYYEWQNSPCSLPCNHSVLLLYCVYFNITKLWLWNLYVICMKHNGRSVAISLTSFNTMKLCCQPETNWGGVFTYVGPECFLKHKTCQSSLFLGRLIVRW